MQTSECIMIADAICPDRDLVVFEDKRFTFSQVKERVNRLADSLRERGIASGDRVGMLQVNCNQYVEAYFACAKLGAIFVPLNFRAKADELSFMIAHAGIKTLFSGDRYMELIGEMRPDLPDLRDCVGLECAGDGWLGYESLIAAGSPEDVFTDIDDEEVTILMYTAGTTGRPKGVPLRHSSLTAYMLDNVDPADPDIVELNLLTVPLYHVAGIQAMLAGVYGGRTLVMMKQFETEEWLRTVEKEKATRAMLVPTMLKWIIDHPDFDIYDLSSLKVITYGAAPMPYEVISKAIEKFPGASFINAFGQTETAATIASLGPEDHMIVGSKAEQEKKHQRLKSSIGKALPGIEIKIADENGDSLPLHATGEIWARGPGLMRGYWCDEEKTKKVITDEGWLRTGDKGWMDEGGYIFLAGRGDDIIIRGGENISPGEVENVIATHSMVEEVAVIGIPDPEWGQQVMAVVVLKTGSDCTNDAIINHCRGKLAGFKKPQSVVFVDELPRNSLGKIMKKDLRETYGEHV